MDDRKMDNQKLIENFIQALRVEKGFSDNTLQAYKSDLKILCESLSKKEKSLLTIDHDDLIDFLARLKDEDRSDSSIARFISSVRGLF
ncbi:MAG: site-specific integrase, partial [Blastocatellia bacterium]